MLGLGSEWAVTTDGDLIHFVPLSKEASSEAKKLLSYENFKQVSNIQDTDWV